MPFFHGMTNSKHQRLAVYQLRATVNAPDGLEPALRRIADLVLPYVSKSLYLKLPVEASDYRSFELENDRGRCECVSVPKRLLWAIRFRFSSKDDIYWFYDIAMIEENSELMFGIKIETSSQVHLEDAQKRIPLVSDLLGKIVVDALSKTDSESVPASK